MPCQFAGESQRASIGEALADIASSSNQNDGQDATRVFEARRDNSFATATRAEGAAVGNTAREHGVSFDLVIASDAIYSASVVKPLFYTVNELLSRRGRHRVERKSIEKAAVGGGCTSAGEQPAPVGCAAGGGPVAASVVPPQGSVSGGGVSSSCRAGTTPSMTSAGNTNFRAQGFRSDGTDATACSSGRTSSNISSSSNSGGSGAGRGGDNDVSRPVFVMCQSFGYDSKTESAIERACLAHGMVREVLWDELAPAQTHDGEDVAAERLVRGVCGYGRGGNGAEGKTDRDRARDPATTESGSLLSGQRRAGTKLQHFWRA